MQSIQQATTYAASSHHLENFEPNLPVIIVVGLTVLGLLANVDLDNPEGLRLRARVQNTTGLLILCGITVLFLNTFLNIK